MKKISALLVTILLLLCTTLRAATSQVAELAPANAAVFVQINDLGKLWNQYSDDPLVNHIREQLGASQSPAIWGVLQTALAMNGTQIVETFFGQSVAVISKETGNGKPGVILSRIEPTSMEIAIQRLQLHPLNNVGDFEVYTNNEANCRLAYHKPWMVFAGMGSFDYFESVLTQMHSGQSLAQDATFKKYAGSLPDQYTALVFSRQAAPAETHAISLHEQGKKLTLAYVGSNEGLAKILKVGNSSIALESPALPPDAMASMAMNFQMNSPAAAPMLNRLIAPKTFENDVMPTTFVLTMHQMPGSQAGLENAVAYPVLSLAMKLKDPALAADMDRLFAGVTMMTNLKTMEWNLPAILTTPVSYKNSSYNSANLGSVLAQRTERPELAAMNLVYGRVGNWYVLTTNNAIFNQYIDAANAPTTAGNGVTKSDSKTFASLTLNAAGLSAQLKSWIAHWQAKRPQILQIASTQPLSPEGKFVKGVQFLAGFLDYFQQGQLQLSRVDDQMIQAQLEITRK